MNIAVASDHAGFEKEPFYKPAIVKHLEAQGHTVLDCGPDGPGAVDYPDYSEKVCAAILRGDAERGVLLCGTGIGMGIAANRHAGIRAAVVSTEDMARYSRTHNNANVICMGSRIVTLMEALRFIDIWVDTPFSNDERHVRRVGKMG